MKEARILKVNLNNFFDNSATAAAVTKNVSLFGKNKRTYEKKRFEQGHITVNEQEVYALSLKNISLAAAEVFGERRVGVSMCQRSFRSTPCEGVTSKIKKNKARKSHLKLFNEYVRLITKTKTPKQEARFVLPDSAVTDLEVVVNKIALLKIIDKLIKKNIYDCEDLALKLHETISGVSWNIPLVEFSKYDIFHDEVLIKDQDVKADMNQCVYDKNGVLVFKESPAVLISKDTPRASELESYVVHASMTNSCYQQLKRHRMSTIIKRHPQFDNIKHPKDATASILDLARKDKIMLSGTYRSIVWRLNKRALDHFVKLRASNKAQDEIRALANIIKEAAK